MRNISEMLISAYTLFCELCPTYMQKNYETIFKNLAYSFKTSISNLKLFEKAQKADRSFQKHESYQFLKSRFEVVDKEGSNDSDDRDGFGDESNDIVERLYTINEMNEEIRQVL